MGPEIDGRFWVTEFHTSDGGNTIQIMTLYDPDVNYIEIMHKRAENLNLSEQTEIVNG
ncbi:hypothetical protein UFOVP29_343 [uncultured Caudovirales phage]|uniref:Uncharacterized protein n=1 Tax=uncultured Caudovirales phage TaxID=2100421 RepID=A0A6J5KLN3_9CAUD|nr:hypothetical protein UFOVP29_343 [uncultured Caudovirales phage]